MTNHDEQRLRARFESLGVRPIERLQLTDNHTVMVSFNRRRELRVHRGYADAPDDVLRAIVRFVAPGTPQEQRRAARREIIAYHGVVDRPGPPPRRRERARPADAPLVSRLESEFAELNARHFDAGLPAIPIRLSARMRTRLGHLTLDRDGRPTEITISRQHLARHEWAEVTGTLLHEMVHLWQCANGHAVDHGTTFRRKAREVGAYAAARRWVRRAPPGRRAAHNL